MKGTTTCRLNLRYIYDIIEDGDYPLSAPVAWSLSGHHTGWNATSLNSCQAGHILRQWRIPSRSWASMLKNGRSVTMPKRYPRSHYFVLLQTKLRCSCHYLQMHEVPIERKHWHMTLRIQCWQSSTRCIVDIILLLCAYSRTWGQFYIIYHCCWLWHFNLVMEITSHALSPVTTFSRQCQEWRRTEHH